MIKLLYIKPIKYSYIGMTGKNSNNQYFTYYVYGAPNKQYAMKMIERYDEKNGEPTQLKEDDLHKQQDINKSYLDAHFVVKTITEWNVGIKRRSNL